MPVFDLFESYRWLLALFCVVYTVVCLLRSWLEWIAYFTSSRQTMVLGKYVTVLLLRARWRRFWWEGVQIALLLGLLGWLIYAHHAGGGR